MPRLYEQRHSGCAIVAGGAPCVYDDVAAARKLRPSAVLLGAAFAPKFFPEIRDTWTQHAEDADAIRGYADVAVHSRPKRNVDHSRVDYIWPSLDWVGATSGFAAGLWARHGLGYDEVILAGVPLSPEIDTHVEGYPFADGNKGFPWNAFGHWHEQIRGFIKKGRTQGITSMSGVTKKILGAPE